MDKTVIELFAGVGGFRVGLNNIKKINKKGHAIENGDFKFVWANQWEPSTKVQHAFDCYNERFNESNNSNEDISLVDKKSIPNHSLLCGGFPCQDYSVARSKATEKGIEGKKGVLWWQIRDILEIKKPAFVLLENVDRLTKSPASQRGRDFAIMLRCFDDLGYAVEWRVINAAEYGYPQRRRRVYIFAYRKTTNYFKKISSNKKFYTDVLLSDGLFAKQFPYDEISKIKTISIKKGFKDLVDLSNKFNTKFEYAGYMCDGNAYTGKTKTSSFKPIALNRIVQKDGVDDHFFLDQHAIDKFTYLRGKKKILRTKPNGEKYYYSEGSMSEYDSLALPGRTMLTSEGTVNRSTHIIMDPAKGKLRLLTPIECERLNQFPDNWTNTGMPEKRRYFMMGNALVCGIINKIGNYISQIIDEED